MECKLIHEVKCIGVMLYVSIGKVVNPLLSVWSIRKALKEDSNV